MSIRLGTGVTALSCRRTVFAVLMISIAGITFGSGNANSQPSGGPAQAIIGPLENDQPETGLALIVVDFDRVIQRSIAMQGVSQSVAGLRRLLSARFREEENRLRSRETELAELRTVLGADEFARERRAFEQEIVDIQRDAQLNRARLDAAEESAAARVREVLIGILAELAEQRGVQAVLDSSNVVLFSPRLNVSEEARAQLDRILPRVNLSLPAELIDLLGLNPPTGEEPPGEPEADATLDIAEPGEP